MKKNIFITLFSICILLSFASTTHAQLGSVIPNLIKVPTDKLPPVPISDSALRSKEVGITIFGYTIPGLSYDKLTIVLARRALDKITDGTVNWINSGFQGSPQYMQDPLGTIADIANEVSGDVISSIGAGAVCSPFTNKLRITLEDNFRNNRMPGQRLPVNQCTFTAAMGNIQNFIDGDFNQGGWRGWVAITQESSNNPFENALNIKATINNDIARQKEVDLTKASWGGGFLSSDECKKINGIKECVTRTPGSVINAQLQKVLGSEVDQLNLTQDFDQIVGALFGQLSKRIFNGVNRGGGLLTGNPGGYSGGGSGRGVETAVTCTPDRTEVVTSDVPATVVNWTATVASALDNPTFAWTGENVTQDPGNPERAKSSYTNPIPSRKTASVTVSGTRLENGTTTAVTLDPVQCEEAVTATRYRAPTGICEVFNGYGFNPTEPITTVPLWNAVEFRITNISGGSGTTTAYKWNTSMEKVRSMETPTPGSRLQGKCCQDVRFNRLWDGPTSQVSGSNFPPFFIPWTDGKTYRQWFDGDSSQTISVTLIDADSTVPPGTIQCPSITVW